MLDQNGAALLFFALLIVVTIAEWRDSHRRRNKH